MLHTVAWLRPDQVAPVFGSQYFASAEAWQRLLDKAHAPTAGPRKTVFRVLLDYEGTVQVVVLKLSSGNPEVEQRGRAKYLNRQFPTGRLGPSTKKGSTLA
ncbi:MAG TPA: hypothetical protein VJQ54_14330 [Candidatus Sulfotelmatobacter sp.]|nr:hypothetical protein [Candidatus Sulfotelmatobacter sp.]